MSEGHRIILIVFKKICEYNSISKIITFKTCLVDSLQFKVVSIRSIVLELYIHNSSSGDNQVSNSQYHFGAKRYN